jgi:rfaE bifunctional protein kinase chain/domain
LTKCLVSGKFKVLHIGHLRLFETAANLADELIVAIDNSDISPDELNWRVTLLKNIESIHEVIEFSGNIEELIEDIKPEYVVKGSEFSRAKNLEESTLAKYGGKLVFSSGNYFYSDSNSKSDLLDNIDHHLDFLARRHIDKNKLNSTVNDFSKLKICIIGDLIIDEFIECRPIGMSQESPSIVVAPLKANRFVGGAGILAKHCSELGAETTFISLIGDDEQGEWARKNLKEPNLKLVLQTERSRHSTLKTRYTSSQQVLFRLNKFNNEFISEVQELEILSYIRENCVNFDLFIFSDFSYGLLTPFLVNQIIDFCKSNQIKIAADSQSSSQVGDISKFVGVDLLTPTEREARIELKDEISGLVVLAEKLRKKLDCKNLILKLGADGVLIHGLNAKNGEFLETDQVKALNSNPQNVSGAGDSLLAGAALSLACNDDIYLSSYVGSMVAAIHVAKSGNLPVEKNELIKLIDQI